MKKFLWLLAIAMVPTLSYAQNCSNEDFYGDPELIELPNRPNPSTFANMVGVTCGREWDQIYSPFGGTQNEFDFTKVASFPRIFHEMQRDYATVAGYSADPNSTWTPTNNPGGPIVNAREGNFAEYYGMNDNWQSYKIWYQHFKASLGAEFDGFMLSLTTAPFGHRGFPVGWFTAEEWGAGDQFNPNEQAIRQNAKDYVIALSKTYCPKAGDPDCPGAANNDCPCMLDVLEIGNEPWGYVNQKTYRAIIEGIFEGMDAYYGPSQWGYDVIPGAFQARRKELPNNDPTPPNGGLRNTWRDDMSVRVPCDLKDKFSGVNIHPYSFDHNGFALNVHPEKTGQDGVDDGSELLATRNAVRWCLSNMPGKKVYVTEYGWDSRVVGDAAQMAYIIRSTLMFARFGIYKSALYEGLDSNDGVTSVPDKMGLFESCGLWETGPNDRFPIPGGQKPSYDALAKLRNVLGDKIFLQSLSEKDGGAYAFILGDQDGTATHLVAWHAIAMANSEVAHNITLPPNVFIQQGNSAKWLDDDLSNGGTGNNFQAPLNGSSTSGNVSIKLRPIPVLIALDNPLDCKYLPNGTFDCSGGPDPNVCDNDTEAPVFTTCPNDIEVMTPSQFAIVTWPNPIVTDNCTFSPNTTSTHQPGAAFDVGTTTVSYKAQDDAGNFSDCSFNIIVLQEEEEEEDDDGGETETEDPSVTPECPVDITVFAGVDGLALVSWDEPLALTNCGANSSDCSEGDIAGFTFLGNHDGSNYHLSAEPLNWPIAKEKCQNINGYLATVDDSGENEFLRSKIKDNNVSTAFIGLSDETADNDFIWTSGASVDYENWASGTPLDNNKTDFAYLTSWTSGQWYSANQFTYKTFVCELPCSGSNMIPGQRNDNAPENNTYWAEGTYTVNYKFQDNCGGTATCTFTVTVEAAGGCDNITDAGTIGSDEFSCDPYRPQTIVNNSLPTGGGATNAPVYQWERSTVGPDEGWEVIFAADQPYYEPEFINETTWYRRGARRKICTDYLYSNVVVKEIDPNDCEEEEEDCIPAAYNGFTYLGKFEDNHYYLSDHTNTWTGALEECEYINGSLVAVNTRAENEWLRGNLHDHQITTAFIGLSDRNAEGLFSWTTGDPANYTHWDPTFFVPINEEPDYAYMGSWTDGPWYPAGSLVYKNFICEISCAEAMGMRTLEDDEDFNNPDVDVTYSFFPNPVSSKMTITSDNHAFEQIEILDMHGRVLKTVSIQHGSIQYVLNVEDLRRGMYFLNIKGDAFGSVINKFLKL